MSAALQMALALGSVAVLLGLMAIVRALAPRWGIGSELQRKIVHIGTGIYAILLPWLFPDRWPIYALLAVTLGVMLVLRLPNSGLGTTLHGVKRTSYGDLLLAVSVGLCLFFAGDQLYLYVLPLAVLTLADAMAALAGSTYGTRFFAVEEGQKSVEGSTVFFAVTLLISVICLMLMTPFAPVNILVLSLMVAAFGTFVEAVSWRGFDNLFLPMGLLIFLSVHAADPLADLMILAAIFAGTILAFKRIAPKIGLTHHAARVYVTAVFLLLAVIDWQNAVFPICTLAAHVWSRTTAPGDSAFPDLDVVASLALVSFGAWTLGDATGYNAISFYGMITMAMTTALGALALTPQPRARQIGTLLCLLGGACLIRAGVIGLNPAGTNWNGPMWPGVIACLALSALLPTLSPKAFAARRMLKVTLLSLAVPVPAYLYAMAVAGGSL
ncbi:diacylglycerol/polyprenol kinase family protein [Phaeovulum sp. W22_SRMD_FR3]|uniref:diacylglycerol/polyprenol kinase family protein n=1 Tax=Phaeovulum sp. W22_SRMD_FR3 TaxID=3240274 RepID=UPI003F9EB2DD